MLICTLVTSSSSLPKIGYICWKTNFATMMGCCMLLSLGSESQSTFASPTWIRTRLAVGVLSQQKLQALRPNVIHARRPCRTRARSAIRFWWIAQVGPRRLTAILGPCIFFWICSPGALGEKKIIHKTAISWGPGARVSAGHFTPEWNHSDLVGLIGGQYILMTDSTASLQ